MVVAIEPQKKMAPNWSHKRRTLGPTRLQRAYDIVADLAAFQDLPADLIVPGMFTCG
jgi:hypothetical protein